MNKKLAQLANLFICILFCLAGGYLLALISVDRTVFNTDSAAPYHQAKLIASGVTTNTKELSFARIPSVFPDLATLITLSASDQLARFHSIFARYAWALASTLIFLQAELSRLTFAKSVTRLQAILISATISIGLAEYTPEFRETVGLLITPLHHGGNVLNTYLFGCIILWKPRRCSNRKIPKLHAKPVFLAAMTAIGITSNKLFIFTALAPALLATYTLTSLESRRWNIFSELRTLLFRHKKLLALLTGAVFIGLAIGRTLNAQCSLPVIMRPLKTYGELFDFGLRSKYYGIGFISIILFIAYSIYSLWKDTQESQSGIVRRGGNTEMILSALGCLFLGFSTLSPLAYIWLLGEPETLPVRYVLILGAGICCLFVMIACRLVQMIGHLLRQNITDLLKIGIYVGMATLLAAEGFSVIRINGHIEDAFANSFSSRRQNKVKTLDTLHELELTQGLSDFWGTEIALVSDLDSSSKKRLEIEPVLSNGKPDLWAHSKYQFMNSKGKIKNYDFVVSTSVDFEKSIIDSYGSPSLTKDLPEIGGKLLLYQNMNARERIRKIIKTKLKKFNRQCDRNRIGFEDR